MRRVAVWCALVTVALVASAAGAGAAGRIVKNGSFEQPSVGSGYNLYGVGDGFIGGWSVVGAPGNVAIVSGSFTQNGYTFDAKGHQWLDLTGVSDSATGLQQRVRTIAGDPYDLVFYVGNVVNPGGIFGTSSTVNVQIDGTPFMTATNSKGARRTTQVWQRFSGQFVASSSRTAITFINGDPSNDTNNGLDAISVSLVA